MNEHMLFLRDDRSQVCGELHWFVENLSVQAIEAVSVAHFVMMTGSGIWLQKALPGA